ncbi:MAG: CvpA family protein [Eubacterium sp.]|nr:CvpA family protein [Eubacterium sp.]
MSPTRIAECVAVLIFAFCVWQGWYQGLLLRAFRLVHVALTLVVAIFLQPYIEAYLPKDLEARAGLAYVIAFAFSLLVLIIIAKLLRIVDRLPVIETLNKTGGILLGIAIAVVSIWFVMYIMDLFKGVDWCDMVNEAIDDSQPLRMLHKWNPLPKLYHVLKRW